MHIEPTQAAGAAFFGNPPEGPIVMLNLLRFRDVADYSNHPDLAPSEPISGRAAYERYAAHAMPFLTEAGGDVLFRGDSGAYLIGPQDAHWDLTLLVRHKSAQLFLAFATDKGYLAGVGHRTASLLDSRLLPIREA